VLVNVFEGLKLEYLLVWPDYADIRPPQNWKELGA